MMGFLWPWSGSVRVWAQPVGHSEKMRLRSIPRGGTYARSRSMIVKPVMLREISPQTHA